MFTYLVLYLCDTATYWYSATRLPLLGNVDVAINVNGAEWVKGHLGCPLTVQMQCHPVSEHPKVQLVPLVVECSLVEE